MHADHLLSSFPCMPVLMTLLEHHTLSTAYLPKYQLLVEGLSVSAQP